MANRTGAFKVGGALLVLTAAACGGGAGGDKGNTGSSNMQGGSKVALPLLTPPVKAAAPSGLQGSSTGAARFQPQVLSPSDFQSRFFADGPTNIFNILSTIDGRIQGINERAQSATPPACFALPPVAYTVDGFGVPVTLYAQCYDQVGTASADDPELVQVGQRDGITYLYVAVGQGRIAAIVTPVAGGDGGVAGEQVEAWMSVGTLNASTSCGGHAAWDGCSYGVIHLWADSSTKEFEMGVAGIGFGYCGAQLRSDGQVIYGIGSTDMGSTCNAVDALCVQAADAMTSASCAGLVTDFKLAALGRRAVTGTQQSFAASAYPEGSEGNVAIDGTASDALHFGPATPTAGTDTLR